MNEAARAFYKERNRRQGEYLSGTVIGSAPVHLTVGRDALAHPAGQVLVLSAANLLARTHRRIAFRLLAGDVERLIPVPFAGERTAGCTILGLTAAIDPHGDFEVTNRPPAGDAITLGIGADAGAGLQWYVGADRGIAEATQSPRPVTRTAATTRGAALAACLGAAGVFLRQLGLPVHPSKLSAWNWAEGSRAATGPEVLDPVSVGDVLFVGAGAVGNAVAYWLRLLGADSRWAISDGDVVKLLNTDRSLLFSASHAGWAGGHPGGSAEMKANVLEAWLPGAVSFPCWYDQASVIWGRSFDVVLALANEREVRQLLAARHPALALQATTGERFLAQLHRHILGHDDCISCRTGQLAPPRLGCATEPVAQPDGTPADAALPFLSAASGLMLVTALQRLQAGELAEEQRNRWEWRFGGDARVASSGRHQCHEGCPYVLGPDVRSRVTSGQRWAHLVG